MRSKLFSPRVTRKGVISQVTITAFIHRNSVIFTYREACIAPSLRCFSYETRIRTIIGTKLFVADRIMENTVVLTLIRVKNSTYPESATRAHVTKKVHNWRKQIPRVVHFKSYKFLKNRFAHKFCAVAYEMNATLMF